MCSLDLFNWYEDRFPNDFNQLKQIKHYNLSDVTFLLSKVWSKLDYGEKLLMCAIYYDDENLAKQMLNEKLLFKVNPFWSKRYYTRTPHKEYFRSSSGSVGFRFQNIFDTNNSSFNSEIFVENIQDCWCKVIDNQFRFNHFVSRVSFCGSVKQLRKSQNSGEYSDDYTASESSDEDSIDLINESFTNNVSSSSTYSSFDSPTYYFDQRINDFNLHSPFYFAVKLNNFKMCKLFIEHLKQNSTSLNMPNRIKNKLNEHPIHHHRNCAKCSFSNHHHNQSQQKVYLNMFISKSELIKLLVLALSKHNYDIAMLILSNVEKPKQILNFKNLSESFIYNKEFCLYLVKNKIIEETILLKESTNRHAIQTTSLILNYLEQQTSYYKQNKQLLINIYKQVLLNSISISDLFIFRLILNKLVNLINLSSENSKLINQEILKHVSVKMILDIQNSSHNNNSNQNHTRSSNPYNFNSCFVDLNTTCSLASSKQFDCDAYFNAQSSSSSTKLPINNDYTTSFSYFNRLKLVQFLFDILIQDNIDNHSNNNKYYQETSENEKLFLKSLDKDWKSIEDLVYKKLVDFSRFFEPIDQSTSTSKKIFLGRYFLIRDSEPLLVKSLIEDLNDKYEITRDDLITVAKCSSSELTLYYLISNLEFFNQIELLEPVDQVYGNFLEIIFCRLVKCTNKEQELRLRRLFIEAIVLKNAKMTCSTNLLNLFVTNSQFIKNRLLNVYFPCLFYLSNSFNLFYDSLHKSRFEMLVKWLFKNLLFKCCQDETILNNQEKIEFILFEYYSNQTTTNNFIENVNNNSNKKCHKSSLIASINFDISLKDLARNSFMKIYLKHVHLKETFKFMNLINDSNRQYLSYFNEIKNLFNFNS